MHPLDELKKMREKELEAELKKAQVDLIKLRLAVATRQSKETSNLKGLRKYISRIKTLQAALKFEKAPENAASSVIK